LRRAAPPVGDLRWQAPQPPAHFHGTFAANDFGSHCIQSVSYPDMTFHDPGASEDCLTLNVWAPVDAKPGTLPVMVWIYGGGFTVTRRQVSPAALGAFHSDDIEYVFGTLDSRNIAVWRPEDRKLSDQIQQYWTNFARTVTPTQPVFQTGPPTTHPTGKSCASMPPLPLPPIPTVPATSSSKRIQRSPKCSKSAEIHGHPAPALPNFRGSWMNAIVYQRYGSPGVLEYVDIERPTPRDRDVLIRVRAASVNPLDSVWMRGKPYILRLVGGLRKPRDKRIGADVAGEVEATGSKVTQFKSGDQVFGMCKGAFAEYACVKEATCALKPSNIDFKQAAALPIAAISALQSLRDKGRLQPGQRVLINGAAGGVGSFAVQITKAFGGEVTAVCSTRNLEMVRSLGADRVLDYTQQDLTEDAERYDLFLDCIGNHPLLTCRRILKPKGIYVAVGGPIHNWLSPFDNLLKTTVLSLFVGQNFTPYFARPTRHDLEALSELILSGQLTPYIDKVYPLSEVPEAIRYIETRHARGKIVIDMDH
jgi:NADPH:quinone reductase-like Zn-dependent oxidoreductase